MALVLSRSVRPQTPPNDSSAHAQESDPSPTRLSPRRLLDITARHSSKSVSPKAEDLPDSPCSPKSRSIWRKTFTRSRSGSANDGDDSPIKSAPVSPKKENSPNNGGRLHRRKSLGSFLSVMTARLSRDYINNGKDVSAHLEETLCSETQIRRLSRPLLGDLTKDSDRRISAFRDNLDWEVKRITSEGLVPTLQETTPLQCPTMQNLPTMGEVPEEAKPEDHASILSSQECGGIMGFCADAPSQPKADEVAHKVISALKDTAGTYKVMWIPGRPVEGGSSPEDHLNFCTLVLPVSTPTGTQHRTYRLHFRELFSWVHSCPAEFSHHGLYDARCRTYFMQPRALHDGETPASDELPAFSGDVVKVMMQALQELVDQSVEKEDSKLLASLSKLPESEESLIPHSPTEADWKACGLGSVHSTSTLFDQLEPCRSMQSLCQGSFRGSLTENANRLRRRPPMTQEQLFGHYMDFEVDERTQEVLRAHDSSTSTHSLDSDGLSSLTDSLPEPQTLPPSSYRTSVDSREAESFEEQGTRGRWRIRGPSSSSCKRSSKRSIGRSSKSTSAGARGRSPPQCLMHELQVYGQRQGRSRSHTWDSSTIASDSSFFFED